MIVNGASSSARALAEHIRKVAVKMMEETNKIRQQLLMLSNTYVDFGYQDFSTVVSNMTNVLHEIDTIGNVYKQLITYADILDGKLEGIFLEEQKMTYSNQPRQMDASLQLYRTDKDGLMTFNHPEMTRNIMDLYQGKVFGFSGTCGLVSCVNVLRLAGIKAQEADIVKYAKKNGLCSYIPFHPAGMNGGTSFKEREEILKHFGLDMESDESNIDNIASHVELGQGVIISVYASVLWYDTKRLKYPHAITITSVKRNKLNDIVGFYVADSGYQGKDIDGYYSVDVVKRALTGTRLNYTKKSIR